jgi:hypothetical protein
MILPFYNRQKFVQYRMMFSCRLGMFYIDFQFGVDEKYYINNGATVVVWFVIYIYTNLHFVQSKEIFIGLVHPISSSRQRRFNHRIYRILLHLELALVGCCYCC